MQPLLRVENLSLSFGTTQVVKDVHFNVFPGQTLALVGESGSGKSLTCLSLMGLTQAKSSGTAYLEGAGNLLALSEKQLRALRGKRIAMIFQEPMTSLNPVMSVGKQVQEAILVHQNIASKEAKSKTIDLFQSVELPQPSTLFHAYPHQLSGGQKQRVMIAMAMANQPDILIADEPTTALDVTVQHHILDLLQRLAKAHQMAMIFITHDLGVVRKMADHVVVMRQGKIMEQGPAHEVLSAPKAAYTQGLMACRPPRQARPLRLPTVEDVMTGSLQKEDFNNERPTFQPTSVLLEARNISVTYPGRGTSFWKKPDPFHAVKQANLQLYQGEILGLVGESGSGKSTLGRALLRLQPHATGEIYFQGQALHTLQGEALRKMRPHFQLIFQDPFASLNPYLPIGEAIAEPMWVHRVHATKAACKNAALALMEQVGLSPDMYQRLPHQFSGGQRQRIGIARALGLSPKLLVCDESVAALDVSIQAQILNVLLELREKFNLSILFISHDLGVVRYLCDRILVMQHGQIVEEGLPNPLFTAPQHPYTRTLIEGILP
jgi:peptide/nickel transport system ATP-binding protein